VIQSELFGNRESELPHLNLRGKEIVKKKRDMNTQKLSKKQREILVGILLGDAHLERPYGIVVEQGDKHKTYIEHLLGVFAPFVGTPRLRARKVQLAFAPVPEVYPKRVDLRHLIRGVTLVRELRFIQIGVLKQGMRSPFYFMPSNFITRKSEYPLSFIVYSPP